ncbi:unnamed protein product [Fusarium graminearum]|uniref:Uncharacterized protein n=1 Tax=Gibberella zeae TaxID=5518 RepID=A0A4E9EH01_GIBZA|nr:unnamed protein product [Fusarium graminearum]CAF3622331.1 unnamed protein product [Fusarium graminearum]CAG1960800.1 unnamed protein product [Fusarium graminearum]CAG2002340.1 unnamed protein product [Fusarium graminearum]
MPRKLSILESVWRVYEAPETLPKIESTSVSLKAIVFGNAVQQGKEYELRIAFISFSLVLYIRSMHFHDNPVPKSRKVQGSTKNSLGTGERSFHPMPELIALARRKRVKRQAYPTTT